MASQQQDFSAEDAVNVQRALRVSLGLGPEAFPIQAFVGMISDEIEQLRESGRTDEDIALLIANTLGRPFDSKLIARHYADPAARHQGGGADTAP